MTIKAKPLKSYLITLKALLDGDPDVSALQSGRLKTTRISNRIGILRSKGILIETRMITTPSKKTFGRYFLVRTPENIKNAKKILNQKKEK